MSPAVPSSLSSKLAPHAWQPRFLHDFKIKLAEHGARGAFCSSTQRAEVGAPEPRAAHVLLAPLHRRPLPPLAGSEAPRLAFGA